MAGRPAVVDTGGMRVRQYVSFTLFSEQMPAAEMARLAGLEPDERDIRASRQLFPPLPAAHAWKIVCGGEGLSVDQQIAVVVGRLEPVATQVSRLARHLAMNQGGSRLHIVRYFDGNGGPGPAPNKPLGWRLDHALLEFLRLCEAELTVDEYGPA
jgi:hypothetical protein